MRKAGLIKFNMVNQQELLKVWKSLQEKLTTTLTQLKQRVNPEVLNLEKQILTKHQELKAKQEQIKQLESNLPERGPVLGGSVPPPTPPRKRVR